MDDITPKSPRPHRQHPVRASGVFRSAVRLVAFGTISIFCRGHRRVARTYPNRRMKRKRQEPPRRISAGCPAATALTVPGFRCRNWRSHQTGRRHHFHRRIQKGRDAVAIRKDAVTAYAQYRGFHRCDMVNIVSFSTPPNRCRNGYGFAWSIHDRSVAVPGL